MKRRMTPDWVSPGESKFLLNYLAERVGNTLESAI
jgi:hypothetical protein